jgi:hypothetical protein
MVSAKTGRYETKQLKQGGCLVKSQKLTVVCLASIFYKFRVTTAGIEMLGTDLIRKITYRGIF